jgi:two-component system response regulator AtoC
LNGSNQESLGGSLPPNREDNLDMESNVEKLEISLLAQALTLATGNKAKAARLLKISERTLWYKLKKYGIR